MIWKESIKWKDNFIKQNIRELDKLLKDCDQMLADIIWQFKDVGCQIKKGDNARDAIVDFLELNKYTLKPKGFQ